MDDKVKNTLPTQVQKTEYVKRNLSHLQKVSSSVTHPSVTMSSRKFSAISFLLENNDIIQKIPSHLDPSMFSDDEDDVEQVEEPDEQAEEENSDAAGICAESDESHLQASSSMMSGCSTANREFHSSSGFRSAYPMHSTGASTVLPVERERARNENKFQQSADFRSHEIKHSIKSEVTSSREKTQNENRYQHSAGFRSLELKHLVKPEASSSREKMWKDKRFQDSVDHGSHDPKPLVKLELASSRSLPKRQDDNTIEDFNWRKKPSKPSSYQASSLIKSQPPAMEKIDELPNKSTDQKISSSERSITSLHGPLERAKSHEDLRSQKENVPQYGRKGLSHSVKSHSYAKHVENPPAGKEKSAPCVSRENLRSNENQGASQGSYKKINNDTTEESKVNLVIPDGVITVNNKSYLILSTLGSGGSCKVYSVYDAGTQSTYAMKCVNLGPGDQQIMEGYKKEIEYLRKLNGSNRVIKMFDYEYLEKEIRILLEKGDTDFAHYIANEMKIKPLSPIMIKFYWSQMLEAVAEIHELGIVHSDLKPANFLLVAGQLKLIDFGIATSVPADMTSAIRESQVGTLNFISPEALTTHYVENENQNYIIKIGVKSDVWSLGCILYNLVYGHTPFSSIKNIIPKMRAIIDPKHEIKFPSIEDQLLLDVLKSCLKRNPKDRASVEELLKHPYLTSEGEAKKEAPTTPVKSHFKFQDMLMHLESLTPNRMSVVSEVLQKMQSSKKQ